MKNESKYILDTRTEMTKSLQSCPLITLKLTFSCRALIGPPIEFVSIAGCVWNTGVRVTAYQNETF